MTEQYAPSALHLDRLAFRRRQSVRSVVIAAVSTAAVGLVLIVAVTGSPGWPRVREAFFNPLAAREALPEVMVGLWLNIRLLVFCALGALAVGLLVALARTLRPAVFFPARALAASYTYVFRGTPLIIVLYLFTFGIPGLRLTATPSVLVLGGIALILTYGGYLAEVFRAGIESVHPSQRAAARSLGLTYRQTMWHVVLPQAVRRVTPAILNDIVALQKDVGLISLAGPVDAIRAAQIQTAVSYNFTPYVVAGVLFVLMAIPLIAVTDTVTLRAARRESSGRHDVTAPVLTCRGVRKAFGSAVVLRDLDLDLAEHEVVVLIGASGSGKSTLLRCVNLLETVDDGTIHLDGEDITDPRVNPDVVRRRIGIVFQAFNLFPHMTVLENVTLAPRRVHRVAIAEARERALSLLDRVGLKDKAQAYPDRLSGGQQQRVAIVRALVNSPRLLLLDEVTSALDPELVGEVLAMIKDLKADGMTMLIATHEMSFARRVADRVCFLDRGVIVEQGSPAQVLDAPAEPRTRQFLQRVTDAG